MRVSLYGLHRGGNVDPDILARHAVAAEEAGFEGLWVGDHVALPAVLNGAEEERLEAVTTLTYLAAVTKTIRLGAGVLVLPQRNPVLLAKQLTSLDILSGGRLTVGIGVGHIEAELAALGVERRLRGAQADEYLEVMKELWTRPVVDFKGKWVSFDGILQSPRPPQTPHPPIVVGGHSDAAMARAASSANGWFGWMVDEDLTWRARDRLAELSEKLGRPSGLGPVEITVAPRRTPGYDDVRRYGEMGVHRLVVGPGSSEADAMGSFIERTADIVLGRIEPDREGP